MKKIVDQRFGMERALYNSCDCEIINCQFAGLEDGESALKESRNIKLHHCLMDLRYPLWHVKKCIIEDVEMTNNCRAALWYCEDITIANSKLNGIKALRECSNISLSSSTVSSLEFGWKCNNLHITSSDITSEYIFFESSNIKIDNLEMFGKYSFQYVSNMEIKNSKLHTKDAFWHSKNVTVLDSLVEGEYLGWYSDNLTLIRCHIVGTQPLCYCHNLKLIDCTMDATDLSFEYSDVDASIIGTIESVKNPKSGIVVADNYGEIIWDNSLFSTTAKVIKR